MISFAFSNLAKSIQLTKAYKVNIQIYKNK